MQFRELTLPDCLMDGISKTGFTTLTPIQEQSLPFALQGRDIAGQAQTGTGKTAAFLIALFNRLLITPPEKPGMPRALILAPTRELVVQIEKDARDIGRSCNFVVQAIYGGVDYMQQRQALKDGVDVIIGTPGRLIDYLKQKIYSLKELKFWSSTKRTVCSTWALFLTCVLSCAACLPMINVRTFFSAPP